MSKHKVISADPERKLMGFIHDNTLFTYNVKSGRNFATNLVTGSTMDNGSGTLEQLKSYRHDTQPIYEGDRVELQF